jgi:mono/diheme cytochrome c family protein
MPSDKSAAQDSVTRGPKVAAGAKLFALNCAHCHGIDATGGEGPELHKAAKTELTFGGDLFDYYLCELRHTDYQH